MRYEKTLHLLLLLSTVTLLSGCYKIHKDYRPTQQKLLQMEKYRVSTKVNFKPVFADDPTAVGVRKNSQGRETARVYLSDDVDAWLKEGFDKELQMAGFGTDTGPHENQIKITLNVQQFFVEPWIGLWSCQLVAIMKTEVVVETSRNLSRYARKFVSYDKSSLPKHAYRFVSLGSGMFENKIQGVAQRSFQEIIQEIHRLIGDRNL